MTVAPRKRLIIHAGMHKTGSTSIQNYLFHRFDHPEIEYLHCGEPNSSLVCFQAFKTNIAELPAFRNRNFTPEDVQRLRQDARSRLTLVMAGINKPVSVISAESISTFRPGELIACRDFFAQTYEEITVHLYIRPPKSRMESVFQEHLKTRFRPLSEKFNFNFRQRVESFDQVFDKKNVQLQRYRRRDFPDQNIVKHFLRQLSVEAAIEDSAELNTRLSLPAVQLLYVYRMFYPKQHEHDQLRVELLSKLPGVQFYFHSSLYQELLDQDDGWIDWFEERAGFSLEEGLEENDASGITCENDLLAIPQTSLDWLQAELIRVKGAFVARYNNPSSIADSVRALAHDPVCD